MAQAELNEVALKQLLKEVFTEMLQEQRDLLHEVFAEVLEDIALAEVIREGQQTAKAAREDIFRILEDQG